MLGNSNQLDSLAADTRSIARAIAEHWIDGKHNAANNTEKHATWLDSAGTHAEDVSTAAEAVAAAFDKAKVHTPTPHEFADARADIAEANRINDMTGGLMHGRVVAAMSHYAQLQADAVAAMTEYHAEATAALAHIDEPLKPAPPIAGGIPAGHLATMTDADRAALRDYTGDGYQDLNAALRSGILTPDQQARIDAINRALAKLPDYQGIVVRGTDLPQDVLDRYQPGSTVTERAFTSTTTDPAVAGGDFPGNTEFRILSQAGTDVSPYSAYPHESEILFGSGTDFYVQDRFVDPATAKTVIVMIQR
jgi:hypothetical protein